MIIVDNVRLPEDIEQGAQVGPMFQTSMVPLSSGKEEANKDWAEHKITADISYGMQKAYANATDDELEVGFRRVVDFFMLRNGRFRGFLFRNPLDSVGNTQPLYKLPTDPTKYQIAKTISDPATSYKWRVTHPDPLTLKLYVKQGQNLIEVPTIGGNGVPSWTLLDMGIIKLNSPFVGDLFASFDYDVPMRFETDVLRVQLYQVEIGQIPEITIQQVF